MIKFVSYISACLFILILLSSGLEAQTRKDNGEPRQVLTIFLFKQGLPWAYRIHEGMRNALKESAGIPIELNVEYADQSRFPEKEYRDKIFDLYSYKYSDRNIDLVIAVGDETADMLQENATNFFSDIPIVLVMSRRKKIPSNQLGSRMVVMNWGFDFRKTVRIAMRLLPRTRHLYVVGGVSVTDRSIMGLAVSDLKALSHELDIKYLSGLKKEELLSRVSKLPEHSAILYLTMFRDGAGHSFVPRNVLAQISRHANAPVFGIADTYLGHGIVGGALLSASDQGSKYIQLARRILEGEPLDNYRYTGKSNRLMFDWRELKRWSIDIDKLPPDSIVRYHAPSVWDQHKWKIIALMMVLSMQAFAIAFMIMQRVKRNRAEKEAQRLREEFAHVSRVQVMGELAASLAHEINQPLSAVRSYAQAAQRFLSRDPLNTDDIHRALAGIVTGNRRAEEVVHRIRRALKKEPSQKTCFLIRDVFRDVMILAGKRAEELDISIKFEQAAKIPRVFGDRVQIQQVMLNLLINSMESIAAGEGRKRLILVRVFTHGDAFVLVSVHDSGGGIDESHRDILFDAFYTTKSEGMGMGLSICRTIIEEHGGKLQCFNDPDRGATFSFTMPICRDGKI